MSRIEAIVKIVGAERKVEVSDLASRLSVSNVTIRKDLDKLESRGILSRQHGYAILNTEDDLNYRLAVNYDKKLEIAKKAAEDIQIGETLMIESGSTCALLAEQIALHNPSATIITNSNFIATFVRKYEGPSVILLGGEYQKDSQVNVGPLVQSTAKHFHVDKLFIGVDGIIDQQGFTGSNLNRVNATRSMAQSAENVIVLTDSSKFQKKGVITEFSFEEISSVYTDSQITKESKHLLEAHGITVRIP